MTGRTTGTEVDGGVYVDAGGRRIWHFRGGDPSGRATVLLHGTFASARAWGAQIGDLGDAGLDLYVPERSGHGHTPDVPGPYSFDDMAAETIAYLQDVVGGAAHLIGWGDGGVIALLVARFRPDLVNRAVVVSTHLNPSGLNSDEFAAALRERDSRTTTFLRGTYNETSPDGPEHFDTVLDKTVTMLDHAPDFAPSEFGEVAAPTLVVAADRGAVRVEHALELSRTLPRGRLAVLPGTEILPVEAPELFNPLVVSFLAADPPSEWSV